MRTFKIKFAYRCLLQNCQQMQNLQDLNSRTFRGFSRTFKHRIFKGLEVFIPSSSIFKDFSSMLWTLQWRSRDPHTITHTCIPAASQSQPSPLDQDLRIPSTVGLPSGCWPAWQRPVPPGPPISASLQYVLRTLLPPPTTQNYSLRNTPHNRQLPDRLSRIMDCNFTVRMLYRNMCLWSYDLMALYKSVYYYYYYWLLYILDLCFVLFLCTTAVCSTQRRWCSQIAGIYSDCSTREINATLLFVFL